MPDETPVIMFDSPEAAQRVTVEGWRSRRGLFYGNDERTARFDGCTHRPCEGCGVTIPREPWTHCRSCQEKNTAERFAALPDTVLVFSNDDRVRQVVKLLRRVELDAAALTTLRAEVARLRAVTGPPCPECGHYLKVEHHRAWNLVRQDRRYYRLLDTCSPPHECEIWRRDLIANHPEIAKELGLATEVTGHA